MNDRKVTPEKDNFELTAALIIEKACLWLECNLYTTHNMFYGTGIDSVDYHTVEEFIEGFKKAMNND